MAQVSVIIPVYNIEAHLRQCLDSVVRQTLTDIEIICVDDGSTDASLKILTEYAARDNRFLILTQGNAGPGIARNAGMNAAKGKYLVFLDSDDWFEAVFLEKMVSHAEKTGADVTICRAVEFDTNSGQELDSNWMLKTKYLPNSTVFHPQEIAEHLFQFTYGMAWDKLYRTCFLRKKALQFPALKNSEDLVFVFSSLVQARGISVLDEIFIHHRINRSTSVSNSRAQQPNAPYEAFSLVRTYLEEHELMDIYERSFLNWAMEFLVWHISNMAERSVQKEYFYRFRYEWMPTLGLDKHPLSYFEDRMSIVKYLLAKTVPYYMFRFIVLVYKKQKIWRKR